MATTDGIGPGETRGALFLAVAMAGVVGTALGFEHIGGYIPCALCLKERIPYYVGAPLMLLAFVAALFKAPAGLVRALLVIGALLMLGNAALGAYHSGVEWGWWPGPESCSTSVNAVTQNAGDLLSDLNAKKPPSCNEAAGRFLGLSFAGWNVVASLALAAIAARLAARRRA